MRAIDLWLSSNLTLSCTVLFNVAFHQLSNTTSSVGYISPSDLILRLLSGVNIDIDLPGSYNEIRAWFLNAYPAIAKFHEDRAKLLAA